MAQHFTIQPLHERDIPTVAKMGAETFLTDRQTQLKKLGKGGYDMEAMALKDLPNKLKSKKCVTLKAMHNDTRETMGFITWVFRGFEDQEVPRMNVIDEPLADNVILWRDEKANAEVKERDENGGSSGNNQILSAMTVSEESKDSINRLEDMEGKDFTEWMQEQMPEGTKCMFIGGFHVAPRFQRQGVGAALLKWGTDVADNSNVFAWVHSSEAAWKAYSKAGFEVIRELDVDLDQWAAGVPPPKEDGEGALWGHYVIRYMKRLPKA